MKSDTNKIGLQYVRKKEKYNLGDSISQRVKLPWIISYIFFLIQETLRENHIFRENLFFVLNIVRNP